MRLFRTIREFFWPLLENQEFSQPEIMNVDDIDVDSSHLKNTLEYAINCYDSELERKKTVESKSSLFIGTISVVTSVVIGVTSVLVRVNEFSFSITLLVFLLFILTVYMSRTVWFSIKTLERKNFHSTSISDFLISDSDDDYFRKIISEIANKTKRNSITINSKVDNMTMAQEYFKRAIVVVAIYAFVILLYFLSKSGFDMQSYFKSLIIILNEIKISGWNTIILYLLSTSAIILSLISMKRK